MLHVGDKVKTGLRFLLFIMMTLTHCLSSAEGKEVLLEDLTPEELEKIFVSEIEAQYRENPQEFAAAELALIDMQSRVQVRTPIITPTQKIGILCLIGKLSMVLKGQLGVCRSGTNKYFTLAAISGGYSFQVAAGFFMGAVETTNDRIDGNYEIVSMGVSPGIAMEGLLGKNGNQKLFLAGVGLGIGFGPDATIGSLNLSPLFKD